MRNCWLAAIAGRQGNEPSDISPEGPAGAQGTGEIGRPGCGAWPGFETAHRSKVAARTARGRVAHGAARPHGRARRPEKSLSVFLCMGVRGRG